MATQFSERHGVARRRVLAVVGARPNFVKVAPLLHALADLGDIDIEVLHTGQHYDRALSDSFIERLDMPAPDHCLGVGSGTHAEQTAAVLVGVERVLLAGRYHALVVPGDVNSTVGAALAASKLGVPVVHLESGLRSGDRSMPEEINRIVTDRLSDLLLCHCQEAVDNLLAEGTPDEAVALVGNTMIDSLYRLLPDARATDALAKRGLGERGYVLATLHRPALVDDPVQLSAVMDVLVDLARTVPVVVPLHPRTRARLGGEVEQLAERLVLTEPLEYLEFVALEAGARLVITDSGGVQEETSALDVPCLTYRNNTERPVTIELGTNRLVGMDPRALAAAALEVLGRPVVVDSTPIPLWDGRAGARAAAAVARLVRGERAGTSVLSRAA